MKKIIIFLIFMMILSFVAYAGESFYSCTPTGVYESCYVKEMWEGQALAFAKIQYDNLYYYEFDGKKYYATEPEYLLHIRCDGDTFYFYDGVGSINCDSSGCSGSKAQLSTRTDLTLDLTPYLPAVSTFVCYANDFAGSAWAVAYTRTTWSTKHYPIIRECSTDSNCDEDQYCFEEHSYNIICRNLVCNADEIIQNHMCVKPELPQACKDAGITDAFVCSDYFLEYIGLLELQLEDKLDYITSLDATIQEKAIIIQQLTDKREEQAILISALRLNIEEQAQMVLELTQLSAEQAQFIIDLDLNIQEQAQMINHLTSNLEAKALLVSQLTAENEIQAQLIKEMKESFENQGIILDSLNLLIEDDAVIISALTDNIVEQAQIIAGMQLNIEDQLELVTRLEISNEEKEQIIKDLSASIEEEQELIERLQEILRDIESEKQDFYNFGGILIKKTTLPIVIGIAFIILLLLFFKRK